jgi:DNA-3-methyladenine glycosylase II
MNYAIAIDFLKDSDPILGQLIDRIGACQLNQDELEGDLFLLPIPVNSPPTTFH